MKWCALPVKFVILGVVVVVVAVAVALQRVWVSVPVQV